MISYWTVGQEREILRLRSGWQKLDQNGKKSWDGKRANGQQKDKKR